MSTCGTAVDELVGDDEESVGGPCLIGVFGRWGDDPDVDRVVVVL
jgi:hypothetical protein